MNRNLSDIFNDSFEEKKPAIKSEDYIQYNE